MGEWEHAVLCDAGNVQTTRNVDVGPKQRILTRAEIRTSSCKHRSSSDLMGMLRKREGGQSACHIVTSEKNKKDKAIRIL